MRATALVILVTMMLVPLFAVEGAENDVSLRLGGAMSKMEMKYLACLIGCNASCPSTCFYKDVTDGHGWDMMLNCLRKCDERHNM